MSLPMALVSNGPDHSLALSSVHIDAPVPVNTSRSTPSVDPGDISSADAKRIWRDQLDLIKTFGQSIEEFDGFRVFRPILSGYPDAAIRAIHHDNEKQPLPYRDIIVASLAADNPGETLFNDIHMLPLSPHREQSERVNMGHIASAINNSTEGAYDSFGQSRWFHSHAVAELEKDQLVLVGSSDVWEGGRESMINELLEWVRPNPRENKEPSIVDFPTIRSHFDVIDMLMQTSSTMGETFALNLWRILPSGNPLLVKDEVQYAVRSTALPSTGSERCWWVPRQVGTIIRRRDRPISFHYKIKGHGGFCTIVHTADVVTARHLKDAAEKRESFWNATRAKRKIREDLRALHEVGVSMLVLSTKWDGVVDLPPGEVTHRICRSMPPRCDVRRKKDMEVIYNIRATHRRLARAIKKAADIDESMIENCSLMESDAARLLRGTNTREWTKKLVLNMEIHKSAVRILKSRHEGDSSSVETDLSCPGSYLDRLENTLIPNLQEVQKTLYFCIVDNAKKYAIESDIADIDEAYCKQMLLGEGEIFSSKKGYACGTSCNAVGLTLNSPKQALVAYNLSTEFLSGDASVQQPIHGTYTNQDRAKAYLLSGCIGINAKGDCEFSEEGLHVSLQLVNNGLPKLFSETRENIRDVLKRQRSPAMTRMTWSGVRKVICDHSKKMVLDISDWVYREVFCILYYAMGQRCEFGEQFQSVKKLLEAEPTPHMAMETNLGTLILDEEMPAGGIKITCDMVKTISGMKFGIRPNDGGGGCYEVVEIQEPVHEPADDDDRSRGFPSSVLGKGTALV